MKNPNILISGGGIAGWPLLTGYIRPASSHLLLKNVQT
jgi:hypothetical protein